MSRTFVPFYHNKTENFTVYYDYDANHFFKISKGKQHPLLPVLSGTAGVIIYSLFKDSIFNFGFDDSHSIILFSLFLGGLIAVGVIGGIMYSLKNRLNDHKIVVSLSKEELALYLREGKKWYRSTIRLLLALFILVLLNIALLYVMPNNGLLFFTNIGLSASLIILMWGVRPIKRKIIYSQFKKEIKMNERGLL